MSEPSSSSSWNHELDRQRLCDQFEVALRAGENPRIEDFLERLEAGQQEAILGELVFLELEQHDLVNQTWTEDEYLARFPQYASMIRQTLDEYHAFRESRQASKKSDTPRGLNRDRDTPALNPGKYGPGTLIGQYEIEERLGEGGMGVVYRAKQRGTDRTVALKFIRADSRHGIPQSAITRFTQEPKAVARLEHDNIVNVYEVGEAEGEPYFSMQYIEGEDLSRLTVDRPLECRKAATILKDVAGAIHFAHEHDVLHRDIKPSNILLNKTGRPYVTDFGLAKLREDDHDLTKSGFGSPNYVSPEQSMDAKQADARSDVYSLGATLYRLLTGSPPHVGETTQQIIDAVRHRTPTPPSQLNPKIDRDLQTICLKCLAKTPSDRYATAHALQQDLERYLDGLPILARPVSLPVRIVRWAKRRPLVASLVTVIAIVAVAFGVAAMKVSDLTAAGAVQNARLAADKGKWEEVLGQLDEAVELGYPDLTEIEIMRMQAHEAFVDYETSRGILQALRERPDLGPHQAKVRLLTGVDLLRQGKNDEGLASIKEALELGLNDADTHLARGFLATNTPSALAEFEAAADADRFHRDAHAFRVVCNLLLGKRREADEAATNYTYLYPNDPSFPFARAFIAAIEGDMAAANRHLQACNALTQGDVIGDLEKSLQVASKLDELIVDCDSGKSGDTIAVVSLARRILTLRKASETSVLPLPYFIQSSTSKGLAGITLTAAFRPAGTAASIGSIVDVNPEGTLYFMKGLMHGKAGSAEQQQQALDAFLEARRLPALLPSVNREATYFAGMYESLLKFHDRGTLEQATEYFEEYYNSGDVSSDHFGKIFPLVAAAKDRRFARKMLADYEAERPEKAGQNLYRAQLLVFQGKPEEAVSMLEAIHAENPNSSQTKSWLDTARDHAAKAAATSGS